MSPIKKNGFVRDMQFQGSLVLPMMIQKEVALIVYGLQSQLKAAVETFTNPDVSAKGLS